MDKQLPQPLAVGIETPRPSGHEKEETVILGTPSIKKAEQVRYIIDAVPADVFEAWVTPKDIEEWWGPEGFTTIVRQLDPVEGGQFSFEMTAPDGSSCCMTGLYRKIQPPYLLVFEVCDHCNLNLPEGVEPQLQLSLVTVRFTQQGTSTEVAVSHASLGSTYGALARLNWSMTLTRLARRLALHEGKSHLNSVGPQA